MTGCDIAYREWSAGHLGQEPLATGTIVLTDGTQCRLDEVPAAHLLPAHVSIPPGQPEYAPPAEMPDGSIQWTIILIAMGLVSAIGLGMVLAADTCRGWFTRG